MCKLRLLIPILSLLSPLGCCGSDAATKKTGDPHAVEVVESHWKALSRGDWKVAYERLHPDLRAGLTLSKFTHFHNRRRKTADLPRAIEVVGSESSGDDVVVSFDVLYAAPGCTPVVVPPLRKVALRKSGDTWKLMTHDVLAVGP